MSAAFPFPITLGETTKTMSEPSTPTPPAPRPTSALADQFDKAAPTLMGTMIVLTAGILLSSWRNEAVATSDRAALRAEIVALRQERGELDRRVLALEADSRQRAHELTQTQKSLDKIEAYNGKTMLEIQQINLQLAEMRGAKKTK